MSKDGGGYGSDEFSGRDNSLSFKVASLEKKIEEYRKIVEMTDSAYKKQIEVLKDKLTNKNPEQKPTKEQVLKSLKRIYGYSAAEAHRYGPQKPDQDFIATLQFLRREFGITEEDFE